jgi:hypothetical protein
VKEATVVKFAEMSCPVTARQIAFGTVCQMIVCLEVVIEPNRRRKHRQTCQACFLSTNAGKEIAFIAASPNSVSEVYIASITSFSPRKLTAMTELVKDFSLGSREIISWQSKDGATIEGVLIKPADFDPSKKHPLLCIIHGGPDRN